MKKAVSCSQMRFMDNFAISGIGIPGAVLMENAAIGVVESVRQRFGALGGVTAAVFCGKGNNGGDGYAAARHLFNAGAQVTVYAVFSPEELTGDAAQNYNIAKNMGITVTENLESYGGAEIVVDAIFGTGIKGPVEGRPLEAISRINACGGFVAAVDVPSGIDANNGAVFTQAVKADITVTFGYIKTGLLSYPAADYAGEVIVCDISIPKAAEAGAGLDTFIPEEEDIAAMLPRLSSDANKGSAGKVMAIAGSRGMSGAAVMLCEAALRSGAGLVYLGAPSGICDTLAEKLTETVITPLAGDAALSEAAADNIVKNVSACDAVAFGPGLGRGRAVKLCLDTYLKKCNRPVVIDADGINVLTENIYILKGAACPIVLTPHPGEFSRMTGATTAEIAADRLGLARRFAKDYNVTLVLKGAHTVVALPDGRAFINTTGNPGMATGGSGDALTGIIAAFLARGMSVGDAAAAGVYVHGRAGDLAAAATGEDGMLPRDLINSIPAVLKGLKGR